MEAPEPPAEPELLHIPCPNGHELETPLDMLEQEVLCPQCNAQFRLRKKDSVEYKRKKEEADRIKEIKSGNFWLNVRNPAIKSLKDFTDTDRIAVPSAKVSMQAIILQMAAEREFGPGQFGKLEHLVVTLPNPDGMIAVLNPTHEVTAHMATQPFHAAEVKAGLKTIVDGYDVLGGVSASNTFVSTEKFRAENPRTYEAVVAAHAEAIAWLNADLRRAAKLFIQVTNEKRLTEDEVTALISEKGFEYTRTPRKIGKFADFMFRTGLLKTKPSSWKDMFFAEAHALDGD